MRKRRQNTTRRTKGRGQYRYRDNVIYNERHRFINYIILLKEENINIR